MSRSVELPDADFERLEEAAAAEGMTPAAWIIAQLPVPRPCSHAKDDGKPRTLAERFAGRVGVVASGGKERLSERTSEIFGEILEEKRRAGRL